MKTTSSSTKDQILRLQANLSSEWYFYKWNWTTYSQKLVYYERPQTQAL